jgi:1,4-dihydroxy-2-naphthoate octaprenyltransferase
MKYKFNLKIQLVYGIISFALSLLIIYAFTKQLDWITAGLIGIFEFFFAGFYTTGRKC